MNANRLRYLILIVVLLCSGSVRSADPVISSYAFVNDDATLEVRKRLIRLHGVYVPRTGRSCRTVGALRCASRAALALEFKIHGFVDCHPLRRHSDRSITAVCYHKGEDLGAYLISQGWAVARPGAPFEYTVLERIAQHRHLGIWELSVRAIAD